MDDHLTKAFSHSIHGDFIFPDPWNAIKDLDYETAGKTIHGLPNSIYQIVHHFVAWARWGLHGAKGMPFIRTTTDEEGNFFPADESPTEEQWEQTKLSVKTLIADFEAALAGIDHTVNHHDWQDFNNGRAIIFIVAHTSYHVAPVIMLQRLLGVWKQ